MNQRDAFEYLINQIRDDGDNKSHRYVIPDHLAKTLLNYQSIRHDLIFIKEAAQKLMLPNLDQTTMSSLWHTIIALYGKCFVSTGQTAKLETNNCFSGPNHAFLKIHDELMNLRHNFVAHRGQTVHEYSLAYIRVDIENNQSEIKIKQLKRNKPEQKDLENYVLLFDLLITLTEEKIKKIGNKVVKKLHDTTNPTDLYKI